MSTSKHPAGTPFCGKVGCDNEDRRHSHVGAIQKNERIVVTAKLPTAPTWAYDNPHGRFIGSDGIYATVALDDGSTRRVSPQNVVRERLWREPSIVRRTPPPLPGAGKPLPDGPWVEESLPLGDTA